MSERELLVLCHSKQSKLGRIQNVIATVLAMYFKNGRDLALRPIEHFPFSLGNFLNADERDIEDVDELPEAGREMGIDSVAT